MALASRRPIVPIRQGAEDKVVNNLAWMAPLKKSQPERIVAHEEIRCLILMLPIQCHTDMLA